MKDLLELANIVTKPKLRAVELIGDGLEGDSKIAEFYDALTEGRFADDDEAAQAFYSAGKNNSAYQKLRKTVKDRLINALFIIDIKQASYSDRQRAYYEAYRDWAAAKILFGKGAHNAAVSICTKLLRISKKYEFTELTLDIYRTLRLFFGTMEGDLKKFDKYNAFFREYETLWRHENLAEELYINLTIRYVNSRAGNKEISEKAHQAFREIEPLLGQYDSYQLHLCGRIVEMVCYSSVHDYQRTLAVCDDAIAFFQAKDYVATVPLQISYYQKMICHVQLRQFDAARKAAEKCMEYLEEGSFNWFKYRELYFILCMHSEEYQEAQAIHDKTVAHPEFENLPRNVVETWMIFEAYLKYLILAGQFEPAGGADREDIKFRLGRFLNEMSVFSKDKRGMNITILIIEVLFQILNGDRGQLIDRVEAIDKYRSRYLQEEETRRCNHFFRMLLQIPKNAFDRELAEQKAAKDLAALQQVPIELANQTYEIEILPYEKLWAIALDSFA